MSTEASDEMLLLLQQMAALKNLDSAASPRKRQPVTERKQRERRRKEIRKEIRQLAKEKRQSADAESGAA